MSFYEISQLRQIDQIIDSTTNYQKYFYKVFDFVQKQNISDIERIILKISKCLKDKNEHPMRKLLSIRLIKQLIPAASYSFFILLQTFLLPQLINIVEFKKQLSNQERAKELLQIYGAPTNLQYDMIQFGKSILRITLQLIKAVGSWIPNSPYQRQTFASLFKIEFDRLTILKIQFPDNYQYIKQSQKEKYLNVYNRKLKAKQIILDDYLKTIGNKFNESMEKNNQESLQYILKVLNSSDNYLISFIIQSSYKLLGSKKLDKFKQIQLLRFIESIFLIGDIQIVSQIQIIIVPWMIQHVFALDLQKLEKLQRIKFNEKDVNNKCIDILGLWCKLLKKNKVRMEDGIFELMAKNFEKIDQFSLEQKQQKFISNIKYRKTINLAKKVDISIKNKYKYTEKLKFLQSFFNSSDIRNCSVEKQRFFNTYSDSQQKSNQEISLQNLPINKIQFVNSYSISSNKKSSVSPSSIKMKEFIQHSPAIQKNSTIIKAKEQSSVKAKDPSIMKVKDPSTIKITQFTHQKVIQENISGQTQNCINPLKTSGSLQGKISFEDSFVKLHTNQSQQRQWQKIALHQSQEQDQILISQQIPKTIRKPSFGFNELNLKKNGFNKKQKLLVTPSSHEKKSYSLISKQSKLIEPSVLPKLESYHDNYEMKAQLEKIKSQQNPKFKKIYAKALVVNGQTQLYEMENNTIYSLNKINKNRILSQKSQQNFYTVKNNLIPQAHSQLVKHYEERISRLQSSLQLFKERQKKYQSEISLLRSEIESLKSNSHNSQAPSDYFSEGNRQKSKQLSYLANQNALLKAKIKKLSSEAGSHIQKQNKQITRPIKSPSNRKNDINLKINMMPMNLKIKKSFIRSKELLIKNQIFEIGCIVKNENNLLTVYLFHLFNFQITKLSVEIFSPNCKFIQKPSINEISQQPNKQLKQTIQFDMPDRLNFKIPMLSIRFNLGNSKNEHQSQLPINILRFAEHKPIKKPQQFLMRFNQNSPDIKYCSPRIQYSKKILKEPNILLEMIPTIKLINTDQEENFYKNKSELIFGTQVSFNKNKYSILLKVEISRNDQIYLQAIKLEETSENISEFIEVYFLHMLSVLSADN